MCTHALYISISRREDSSEKRLQRALVNDEVDLKYSFERHRETTERIGWLINMHPVSLPLIKFVNFVITPSTYGNNTIRNKHHSFSALCR